MSRMRPGVVRIAALIIALDLIVATSFQLAIGATGTPLLTTSLSPGMPVQTTVQGTPAVAINYTDSLSGSTLVVVWLTVHNTLGQTAGNFVATASMTAGQTSPVYVVVFGLASGHYAGDLFGLTADGVPISVTSTLSISL